MIDLETFINKHITHREKSMFLRDIMQHRSDLSKALKEKTLLVIGGAGSIGSSFIRAVLPFQPAQLYVVDTNENGLTELTRNLRSTGIFMPDVYKTYPMDYSSEVFRKMFCHHERSDSTKGFDIVANFSAHKHVRSEKDIYSIEALLRNNVIHAKGLLELLAEHPPELYFCVSTDKAANPVNIMGASKRIMEDLIFAYSDAFPVKTARFANVAFSNGSLPDGFIKRLSEKQPLSAPADVRRFFVSPEESGQICMLSAMLGNNREIFFPKLEESSMMSFDNIAVELLKEQGLTPYVCKSEEEAIAFAARLRTGQEDARYPVYFSPSDTSGEKPYEEFYTEDETADMGRFDALGVVTGKDRPDRKSLVVLMDKLENIFARVDCAKEDIVEILGGYLPDFRHIETGKSLDEKM